MCGLNGILRLTPEAPPVNAAELVATRDAMAARGPDGSGLWLSPDGLIGLGHRRLAIIDLSPTGAQPMHSADGRYTIVFNGEIYNYRELRARLLAQGHAFRSTSDTEVLLQLFARQGPAMLSELRGMYALALWDARERRLFLARDFYGIKPLYYASDGRTLRFASQIKALDAGGGIPRDVDPGGLAGFLLWGSVPGPLTIRKGVRAVPAGHWLEIVDGRLSEPQPQAEPAPEALDVSAALERSIASHLVSDVPVGVFLSAGLDSALIAAVARRHLAAPLRTFTLAFDEFRGTRLDEAPGAAEVARLLGSEHTERRVTRAEIEELWPRALQAMDQPSIDGFNVYLVSHYAHEAGLKVALSGLGGDELFGSYPSFKDVPRWAAWARLGRRLPGMQSLWPRLWRMWDERPKLAGLLRYGATLPGAYFLRRGLFLPDEVEALLGAAPGREALAAYAPFDDLERQLGDPPPPDEWAGVQRLESRHYLRNQLLRDADWASLAHSLELRVPFVDVRLGATLQAAGFEPARSQGKAALVRQLAPELPEASLARAKSGFMVPVGPAGALARNWGRQSRRLALLVLRSFGVELQPQRPTRGGTLFLLTEAFHGPGGIQTHNRDQIQALRRCAPDEALSLLVLNDSPSEVRQPEWQGLDVLGFDRRKWRFAWRLMQRAFAQRPERVLIGHRNFLALAPLVALVSPATERWLLTYGIEAHTRLRWRERLLLRAVERVFAISPQTAQSFRRAGCRREIEQWPCSLPFSWSLSEVTPPRLQPPYRLLTVSRLAPPERYKGIDDTIRAVARLVHGGLDVTLDVVGQGQDLERLRQLARGERVAERVEFRGLVSSQDLRRFYERCDLFVLPSGAEGFGIVFLEAFAFARPVVAADAGGTPFVVRPGESGWLVPYGDPEALAACLAERLNKVDETRRVALAGRRLVEGEFSFAVAIARARSILAGTAR